MKNTKTKFKFIFALAALFLTAFLGGIFTLPSFKANAATEDYNSKYPAYSKVGYYAEYLGTVERQKPEVKSEGIATEFPTYGTTLYGAGNSDEKALLRQENNRLLSVGLSVGGSSVTGLTYDSMDKEGNLYLGGEKLDRKLYKHQASLNMYYGNLSESENAVVKRISYQTRTYGNHVTGLYAPAGEVITLSMSKADFEASGGLIVYIGQSFSNGSANRITNADAVNRMPFVVNAMNLKEGISTLEIDEGAGTVTGYFGSFLGGPIYLKPVNGGSSFTVTISGGVRYSHFILGYTTEDEFKENAASSAPYFDLEVWDNGVRHSGPKKFAQGYNYEQLYNAALFWEKVASLSNQFPSNINGGCGIDFLYDCFVTTQLVPQNTVNCSDKWLSAALDYDTIVGSGCNELLNEYNRRFRTNWGLTDDVVSNDAITLIAYTLFTDISSKRRDTAEDEGLDAQNAYASASLSLRQLKGDRQSDLAVYATLIHSFGQDTFIKAANRQKSVYGRDNDGWFRALVDVTGQDMTYFFTELCRIDISKEVLKEVASENLPMFVPAACIYQTGELNKYNGEAVYVRTMQPYVIEYDTPFEIDFDKVLELPFGFSYKILKCVVSPESGSIDKINSHAAVFTPNAAQKQSGKIYVKIAIQRDDKSFEVEDKILILEFKQKQNKPRILERAVYTRTEGEAYTSAVEAFEGNYAGYEAEYSDNIVDGSEYGNADILPGGFAPNTIVEVKGKIFVQSSGNYRIALRGRGNAALYLSSDGINYSLAATIDGAENTQFSGTEGTYKDIELVQLDWLYFKEVLLISDGQSFLCLGMGKFEGESVTISPLTGTGRAYRSNYFIENPEPTFVGEHRYKDLNNSETINNISGFTRISPDAILAKHTGWTAKQAQSTFGHIYEGGASQSVEFTFYGTRVAIYCAFAEGYGEFEIYIDGKLATTVNLASDTKAAALAYLSERLDEGISHSVRIRGKSGKFNIDSISLRLATDPSTAPSLPDLTPDAGSENEDFRKPTDHPDIGDDNNGGQNTPNGGKDYTGLIVGLSVGGGVLIIAAAVAGILIYRKKRNI